MKTATIVKRAVFGTRWNYFAVEWRGIDWAIRQWVDSTLVQTLPDALQVAQSQGFTHWRNGAGGKVAPIPADVSAWWQGELDRMGRESLARVQALQPAR